MSFDIFLQCFRNGEPATFKRALVEEIFTRDAVDYRPPLTDVTYVDGGAGGIYGADEEEDIQNMMFNHCGGDTFFAALHELAARTNSVVFWPRVGRSIAVTDAAFVNHLPSGFDDMGPAYIVSNGRELEACIFESD